MPPEPKPAKPAAQPRRARGLPAVVGPVLAGVVALLLLTGLAVGLPKVVGDGASEAPGEASAPTTDGASPDPDAGAGEPGGTGDDVELPADVGGWSTPTSILREQGQDAEADEFDAFWTYADEQLDAEAGAANDAERYIELATGAQVAIQAYRGADGPLVPATLQDPAAGQTRILLQSFGDVDCVLDVIAGEVSPTPQIQEMQCRRTSEDLTVRAFVLSGASGESVRGLIDQLWEQLA